MARAPLLLLAACVALSSGNPAGPPEDWVPRIASGDMAYTADLPSVQGGGLYEGFYPVVGNGYLAVVRVCEGRGGLDGGVCVIVL